jgi:hypothetical protein
MNPETKFSRWVCSHFLHEADVQRIEAFSGSGIPDINACFRGVEFWIETKIMQPNGRVYLRKYQYAWIRRRVNAGGRVFIFAIDSLMNVHIYRGQELEATGSDDRLMITSPAFWIVKKRSIQLAEILFHDEEII